MDGGTGIQGGAATAADQPAAVPPDQPPPGDAAPPRAAVGAVPGAAGPVDVTGWRDLLAGLSPAGDDAGRIDQIRALEDIKSACAAAQARITAAFAASQRAAA